ncbi:MAG: hypothetical protein A3B10_00620 [Candidatus Doudnabacteria bacterium RIFCSPLOWO2_01_FULL_44_21]|uniref:HTH psq-type domain-containing protein n=1 Tax=Candidatus Doudnabacteria bacterium RIFCSPLOWO2_01_FULL_44_21 TaxID=1817841 RepID=A0A1F5PY56_9BACT|nr:MAG: hypothetical protein A3B95_00480 [Candidatus Doudnabacteria bacterium RIFCSPHIGHO2_02_FULL_43_13b]OGE94642.1 MAG: hypothetical protein A3B10_00620 [Candidatus Doudnabacteria bacterium RIFCSPLOWO2_01_FULL_44_21]
MTLNTGGALPPTKRDIEHTVEMLLGQELPTKRILELMPFPPSMVRKYVQSVQSRLAHTRLMSAADAVAESKMTVAQAAKEFGVDETRLKEHTSGTKRGRRKGIAEMKSMLSLKYRGYSGSTAHVFKQLFEQLEDGEVSAKTVSDVVAHVQHLNKRAARTLKGWEDRLNAKIANGS